MDLNVKINRFDFEFHCYASESSYIILFVFNFFLQTNGFIDLPMSLLFYQQQCAGYICRGSDGFLSADPITKPQGMGTGGKCGVTVTVNHRETTVSGGGATVRTEAQRSVRQSATSSGTSNQIQGRQFLQCSPQWQLATEILCLLLIVINQYGPAMQLLLGRRFNQLFILHLRLILSPLIVKYVHANHHAKNNWEREFRGLRNTNQNGFLLQFPGRNRNLQFALVREASSYRTYTYVQLVTIGVYSSLAQFVFRA